MNGVRRWTTWPVRLTPAACGRPNTAHPASKGEPGARIQPSGRFLRPMSGGADNLKVKTSAYGES